MYMFVTGAKILLETFGSGADMPDRASSAIHLTLRKYSYHVLDIGYACWVCSWHVTN